MVKRIRMPKYHECGGELKACDVIDSFTTLLEELGYKVADDPRYEGSDMFGVLVSKKKFSKAQLKQLLKDWDDDYNEGFIR
jgi:hypothetical protein